MIKNLKEIIIFFLVVTALGSAAWCFLWKKANVQERILYEDTLFKEKVLKKKAQEQLTRAQNEMEGLQKSIDNLIAKSASLESELLSGRQELELAKRNLAKLKNQNTSSKREIEKANLNVTNLKNRIVHLVKEALNADDRLMLLMKTKDALSQQLEQYEQKISRSIKKHMDDREEPHPGDALSQSVSHQAPIRQQEQYLYEDVSDTVTETVLYEPLFAQGEVLTVNREFAFLVINLGKSQGIEEGMILSIKRDDKNLAQARVETVREHISAAALVDKENLSQIRPGDKAFIMGNI